MAGPCCPTTILSAAPRNTGSQIEESFWVLWEICIGFKMPFLAPDSQFWFQNEYFARKTLPLCCV